MADGCLTSLSISRDNPVLQPSEAVESHSGRDWFHVVVFEWMWSEEGLGLKPGAELMVYALIYRASAHGGGASFATNASMGRLLGYPRETVSRVVGKLLDSGLIWPVWSVRSSRGGRPTKCYAVCQPAIDNAQRRMASHRLQNDLEGDETSADGEGRTNPQLEGNVTKHHVGTEGSFQHGVTKRHIGDSERDKTSRSQRDETSHVTKHHVEKNGTSPARTSVINIPLISTYHVSTDQGVKGDVETPGEGTSMDAVSVPNAAVTVAGHELAPNDVAAFNALVSRSLRPVDGGYVERNLREFARLVSEGVPADVILTAYDEYAGYQRQMLREQGESRPMHLLNWLRQRPNTNIQYVLNRLDDEWARKGEYQGTRRGKRAPATHENPRLERLIDGGTRVWHVTDERGGRLIEGSLGVDSPAQAMALYQAMYEREDPANSGR